MAFTHVNICKTPIFSYNIQSIVGPNVLDLKKPTLLGMSKAFIFLISFVVDSNKNGMILTSHAFFHCLFSFLGSIKNEFSKSFYIYQNFLVWTWAPFWYYYMAIVNSCVRITGGLVVSIFQYTSDLDLYQLMVVSGEVEVLRDGGKVVTLNQTDVVPGDIVKLTVSCEKCMSCFGIFFASID